MSYTKTNWVNDTTPAINATNLNKIEQGIEDAHNVLPNKADKSDTVSNVAYNTTNKKFTKTINGTTSDVVTASKLKEDMELNNVGNFKAVSTSANQGLTDTEKSNARANIGLGDYPFSVVGGKLCMTYTKEE